MCLARSLPQELPDKLGVVAILQRTRPQVARSPTLTGLVGDGAEPPGGAGCVGLHTCDPRHSPQAKGQHLLLPQAPK